MTNLDMTNNAHSILVITLFSGENELPELIDSLRAQNYKNWQHEIIRFLPKFEAHELLRKTIVDKQAEYDYFIKLDADMVLNRSTALQEITEIFEHEKDLDHFVLPVFDKPSRANIHGIHAYRSGVFWTWSGDRLFTDPKPNVKGRSKIFPLSMEALVDHMPNPSKEQAFLLGVHRALKIVQRDRVIRDTKNALFQFNYLHAIWKCYFEDRCPSREVILLGAEYVFQGNSKIYSKERIIAKTGLEAFNCVTEKERSFFIDRKWLPEEFYFKWRKFIYVALPHFWSFPLKRIYRALYLIKSQLNL